MKYLNFNRVYNTNITDIDSNFGGLTAGEIYVIAGPHKSGKSRFAQNLAVGLSINNDVMYVNREDTKDNIKKHMLDYVEEHYHNKPSLVNLEIANDPRISLTDINAFVKEMTTPPKVLIIDDTILSNSVIQLYPHKFLGDLNITLVLVQDIGWADDEDALQFKYNDYKVFCITK